MIVSANILEVCNQDRTRSFYVMSKKAEEAFREEQKTRLLHHVDDFIIVDLSTIEDIGGGGVRLTFSGMPYISARNFILLRVGRIAPSPPSSRSHQPLASKAARSGPRIVPSTSSRLISSPAGQSRPMMLSLPPRPTITSLPAEPPPVA